jgi:hypothetical protein
MFQTCLAQAFSRYVALPPEGLPETPAMTSPAERAFLYHLAAEYYEGAGLILDGGAFLGASAACLAAGLRKNRAAALPDRPIISVDHCVAGHNTGPFFKRHGLRPIAAGEMFDDLVRSHTREYADLIDFRVGDIVEVGAVDAPIEILFLDVLKFPRVCDFAIEAYFPRLIPGRSIIVHQDYFIDADPWIRERQEMLAPYFAYVGEIGPSAVFHLTRAIPDAVLRKTLASLSLDESLRLLSAAEQRSTDPNRRALCALTRVWRSAEIGGPDAGAHALEGVLQTYGAIFEATPLKRLKHALGAARYVCANPWSAQVEWNAMFLSVGHPIPPADHPAL